MGRESVGVWFCGMIGHLRYVGEGAHPPTPQPETHARVRDGPQGYWVDVAASYMDYGRRKENARSDRKRGESSWNGTSNESAWRLGGQGGGRNLFIYVTAWLGNKISGENRAF